MPGALTPLLLTLKVALLATLLAGVCGVATAKLLGRRSSIGRDVAESLLTLKSARGFIEDTRVVQIGVAA